MKYINDKTREIITFIICGGVNTLLTYVIYILLNLVFSYSLSYSVSFAAGIFITYFLNSRFVFKEKLSLRKAISYPVVYLVQYLLGIIGLYMLVEIIGIGEVIAPLLIVALTVPITYLLSRAIIKGHPEKNRGRGE